MRRRTTKKPFYKRVWFWSLVAVLLVGSLAGGEDSEAPQDSIVQEDVAEDTVAPPSLIPTESTKEETSTTKEDDPPEDDTSAPADPPEEAPPADDPIEDDPQPAPAPEAEELPTGSTFEVHFLDVGQADAALVLCDGQAMLIDGGNSADSSLIFRYLQNHDVSHLDYIVATHGHEDHVGGLSGALVTATVDKAYCSVRSYDTDAFENFVEYLEKQGKNINIPAAGDSFDLGSASVTILGVDSGASDHNNSSIVLRIVYGNTSFLFTGDAEREAEQTILDAGYTLESTVLKVGHHGSADSTTYPFLRAIAPQYAVISVGKDNSYGHPTEEALSRLRDADVQVFRTDLQGTIVCTSDGQTVSFSVSKNADADTLAPYEAPAVVPTPTPTPAPDPEPEPEPEPEPGAQVADYVGNKNSKKFHYDWCGSVDQMSEKNKFYYTGTRDDMISMGYKPCKNCNP